MKILSTNLGQVVYSKNPKYVTEVIKGATVSLYLAKPEIKIEKKTSVLSALKLEFSSKDLREKYGFLECAVVADVELNAEDIKRGDDLKHDIFYFCLVESWPIFESKIKLLNDIKIDFHEMPPVPDKDTVNYFK